MHRAIYRCIVIHQRQYIDTSTHCIVATLLAMQVTFQMVIAPITLQQVPFDLPLNFPSGYIMTHVSKLTTKNQVARVLKHKDAS